MTPIQQTKEYHQYVFLRTRHRSATYLGSVLTDSFDNKAEMLADSEIVYQLAIDLSIFGKTAKASMK